MNKALVLDGELKGALCAARVLGQRGVPVIAASMRPTAMTLHSRYTDETFIYPAPKSDSKAFLKAVTDKLQEIKAATGQPAVVYMFSDSTATLLFSEYESLKDLLLVAIPSPTSFAKAFDKLATAELADTLGVPTIPSHQFSQRHELSYPVVVKNRRSVVWQSDKAVSGSAEFVFSPQKLREHYLAVETTTGESPLIQSFITGDEYGVEAMCADGEILQSFSHKRIRSLSPRGGAAVVKETSKDTEEVRLMKQYAAQLIRALNWTGPAMVEFKLDTASQTVYLMEINGRFWGSLPLAQAAGVDFVGGYYDWVTAGTVPKSASKPKQMRTYHFLGDVKWLLAVLFKKDLLRKRLYPSRIKALLDFGIELFRGRSDVFSILDPLPSYYEVVDIIKRK